MRRLLPVLALVPLVAGCASFTSSESTTPRPPASIASSVAPQASPNGPSSAPATSSEPHRASVSVARWRLPVASARQAVIPVGHGSVVLAGGLVAGDRSTGEALEIDLATGRTARLPSLAVPVHDVAGALLRGSPAVVGGGNAAEQDVVQVLTAHAWHVTGHLPTARSDLSVVQSGPTAARDRRVRRNRASPPRSWRWRGTGPACRRGAW